MATRKKPTSAKSARRKKSVTRDEAIAILAKATGRPRRQIARIYKGQPDALRHSALSKSPSHSFGRFFYEARIKDTQKRIRRGKASREVAISFYEAVKFVRATRLDIIYLPANQKTFKGFNVQKEGRILKTGDNRGKRRFVYDNEMQQPVSKETAQRIRTETRTIRIANFLTNVKVSELPRFVKSRFTKSELQRIRARKGQKPTLAELKKVSSRISRDWSPKLFHAWSEVYGAYP